MFDKVGKRKWTFWIKVLDLAAVFMGLWDTHCDSDNININCNIDEGNAPRIQLLCILKGEMHMVGKLVLKGLYGPQMGTCRSFG